MIGRPDPQWPTPLLPTLDRDRGHLRTPDGTIVPLAVIGMTASVLAILGGLEATFGITNWISIPAAIAAMAWAGTEIDLATIHHQNNTPEPDSDDRP